jgi:hypothetical protein
VPPPPLSHRHAIATIQALQAEKIEPRLVPQAPEVRAPQRLCSLVSSTSTSTAAACGGVKVAVHCKCTEFYGVRHREIGIIQPDPMCGVQV